MSDERFGAVELGDAIRRSRSLLPLATDALCEVITEVTGTPPLRERVDFVGTFWLMHACDREVFGQPHAVRSMHVEPDPPYPSDRRTRSDVLSVVGVRQAPVRIIDPYLKTSFADELSAALKSRKQFRWQSVARACVKARSVQHARRLEFARRHAGSSNPKDVFRRAIALTAPVDVVEQHHDLTDWAQSNADGRARICYSANAHQASASFRHQLFEQRQIGSKIVFHQHGGGNGIDELHPGEFHDTTIGDVFYTWGWERPDLGRRVRPMPTALPQRHRGEPTRQYLLMSLPVTSHFYRLQPFLIPHHVTRAVDETVGFVKALEQRTTLCVRSSQSPFPMHRLQNCRATVTRDNRRGSGARSASRSRLVVHNYLGTTWLETLAMNIPTVCFFDPNVFRPRESARPYFELLERIGVIHHSGIEAAKFVNGLNGDPRAWWQSVGVQEAREAFVARYANFSDNWLPAWIEEFERLLAE